MMIREFKDLLEPGTLLNAVALSHLQSLENCWSGLAVKMQQANDVLPPRCYFDATVKNVSSKPSDKNPNYFLQTEIKLSAITHLVGICYMQLVTGTGGFDEEVAIQAIEELRKLAPPNVSHDFETKLVELPLRWEEGEFLVSLRGYVDHFAQAIISVHEHKMFKHEFGV
ncbi:hypothetical protein LFL96_25875 [Paraburkholderia sp. D15]|uniref:hypothetical protein n=1 Tax=Paraburkholderia sp. D15 TaxID=2880218 RepID=UPI0024783A19|nr:hypothetical protein [Paraburkholderia sp. D15]WGS54445.1 hypothetical protein LFL96_25875 [Paraburkholderia sp. D15]